MAKDAVATMGTILTDDVGGRDAVHVAVIAVKAGVDGLSPGDRVALENGVAYYRTSSGEPIGIVDPFLAAGPRVGERFWLYLYPRTITSLRHNWTHPAFPDENAESVYSPPAVSLAAQQWMQSFAEMKYRTYEEIMEAAARCADTDEPHPYGWIDGDSGVQLSGDFWDRYEQIVGKKVSKQVRDVNYFSCSC